MDARKPYFVVILIQSLYAGMFLLSKAAFDGGMNSFIFIFYRQASATIFLIPLAFYFEWKDSPRLSMSILWKNFVISLCGITLSLDVYGIGLTYTSATLAAATTNFLPVTTFLLSVLFGLESLKLRSIHGVAKMVGIVICIGGVATLAFYQGPGLQLFGHHNNVLQQHHQHVPSSGSTWIKGCFFMLISNTFWALWIVFQGRVLKCYPSKLLCTTLQCFMSSIQAFVIAIAVERDPQEWKLGWNVRLLAVAYCGIVVTGVAYYLQTWVIEKKGPVFLAMSTPLSLVITSICSLLLLGEVISLGSILGGLLLIGGLYSVLWGKSIEQLLKDSETSIVMNDIEKACTETKEADQIKSLPLGYLMKTQDF